MDGKDNAKIVRVGIFLVSSLYGLQHDSKRGLVESWEIVMSGLND